MLNLKLCVVILLISFSFADAEDLGANTAGEFHPVDSNQIPNILTMISAQVRSNYERIKTWQGDIDVTTDFIDEGAEAERVFRDHTNGTGETPKIVKEHIESRHQFAIDLEKDCLHTNLRRENPPYYTDFESGRNLGAKSLRPLCNFSIATPEYFIHSAPDAYRGDSVVRRSAIKQARLKNSSTCVSNMHPVYDPRKIFKTGGAVWESFPRMLQYINEHGKYSFGGYDLKVEESISGNITKYRIVIPNKAFSGGGYHFLTMVFPSKAGFNMTSYEVTDEDGRLLQEWKFNYDLIDGIYLPSATGQQNFTREGGKLSYEKRYTFKNQKVNKPIPEETFTYKNLGLKNGDKFIDKILGKEYTYQDEELIPVN